MNLYADWIEAKAAEKAAQDKRRIIEDEIITAFDISENLDGTLNLEDKGYKLKLVGRMNRKVDADKLQEVARDAGLESLLSSLFRWEPEINMTIWKATDPAITSVLSKAITVKPGRPSFSIEKE